MNRREFLGAAAGAGAIGWLGHYFLGRPAWAGDEKAVESMGDVALAYRRASGLGKPLLVLVIPVKDDQKLSRGQAFGALLNHGGKDVYLDLALCELACAAVADLPRQLPDIKVTGEPLMVLVETGAEKATATPIDPELGDDPTKAEDFEKIDAFAKQRLETIAAALHSAVAPDREAVAKRAALAEKRLRVDELKSLREMLDGKAPGTPEAYDRGAAIVRARTEDPRHKNPDLAEALAAAAEKRVTGPAPAGAKWAKCGCGVEIEGETRELPACGMAYVPKLSERFLWLFTK